MVSVQTVQNYKRRENNIFPHFLFFSSRSVRFLPTPQVRNGLKFSFLVDLEFFKTGAIVDKSIAFPVTDSQ